jgi:hypothetical protein
MRRVREGCASRCVGVLDLYDMLSSNPIVFFTLCSPYESI